MRCDKPSDNINSFQYSFEFLRRAIIKAGGEPFYLTPPKDVDYYDVLFDDDLEFSEEDKRSIDFWLDSVGGVILPGGEKFTKYDLYILDRCIKKDIPVLGFCLGMQIMSVYKKESDDLEIINTDINHSVNVNKKLVHSVKIDKSSKLYNIISKDEIMVNSYHKFRVKENPYYKTVAKSPDGVIEAMEMEGATFNIGVQWHPEKMYDSDIYSKKIIDEFIKVSSKRETILDNLR